MAELQLKIPYKTMVSRMIFVIMCILFPLWSVMAPATLGLLISNLLRGDQAIPLSVSVPLSLTALAFILGSVAITALVEDNCVYVSKDGMSFPLFFLPALRFRRNRGWEELIGAHVTGNGMLMLSFEDQSHLSFKLSLFKERDIEQFLLALELWATKCKRSDQLLDYQKQRQNKQSGATVPGYTQMWEEELRHRFTGTAFMPLEPEHSLCGGRLKVVRQLAFGGLSAIYLVQKDGLDLMVLKEAVIPPNADEPTRLQAESILNREAQMLSRLSHPNIARVLDHFQEDSRHYLLLEYVNGQDLRQYVKQHGKLSQAEAIDWAIKIAEILKYLHSQSPPVIHRDLTPDNLVLSKDDIFMIDFGAANQFVGAATGTIVGKQAYIPPEQLRGKSTTQSDFYAFGGTIYYFLTGEDPLPLSAAHPQSKIAEIDDELDQLVAKCSAFECEDRYQNADEIIEALKRCRSRLGSSKISITLESLEKA